MTMGSVVQDLRFAARSLLRDPFVTVVAVGTLALGIGASTAIFSVLDGVALKPLALREPNRLLVPWETFRTRNMMEGRVSYPNLAEWRSRTRAFDDIAGVRGEAFTLTGQGLPERVRGARVTANFFDVVGATQAQGRLFVAEDDLAGAHDVVVVTRDFWDLRFADQSLTGTESLILNDRPHTIVGVLPAGFDFPLGVAGAQLWTPSAQDFVSYEHREWPRLIPIARLSPDATLADARSDMDRIARELERDYPETNADHGANVVPLMRQISSRVENQLLLFMGAVGLVLMVACLNVANLLLVRGGNRQRELGVRAALGAGRARVVRQLLTEGLLLGSGGGVLGTVLALAGTGWLVGLLPGDYPRLGEISVDGRSVIFAVVASGLTCIAAALFPALVVTGSDIQARLKDGVRSSATALQRRLRQGLVVAEVALAVVVLVGSGLLVRSFQEMWAVDPGFDAENLLTFRVATGWSQMDVDERAEFYSEAALRIEELPGVTSAAAGTALPISQSFHASFQHVGEPEIPRGERPIAAYLSVTPNYFETLGIEVRRGSTFAGSERRDSPGVALVNEAAAREFWPGQDPLGKSFRSDVDITLSDPVNYRVIGIVADVRDLGLDAQPSPTLYVPHRQQTWPTMRFAVRTAGETAGLVPGIRGVINELAEEASFSFTQLDAELTRSTEERRFITLVMAAFAVIALTLTTVGVFAVLSYAVSQRTRELGLRRALGADGTRVVATVTRESSRLLSMGLVLGLVGSLAANRVVDTLLFGVATLDVRTYLGTLGLVVLAGMVASFLPVWTAIRLDPMVALKAE
jgi:putative ABC transport system permease protein